MLRWRRRGMMFVVGVVACIVGQLLWANFTSFQCRMRDVGGGEGGRYVRVKRIVGERVLVLKGRAGLEVSALGFFISVVSSVVVVCEMVGRMRIFLAQPFAMVGERPNVLRSNLVMSALEGRVECSYPRSGHAHRYSPG